MSDPKHDPHSRAKTETKTETGKQEASERQLGKDDPPPGELIEGEASPGLTIIGGGGHA
jgi:hypothetical protein